MDIHHLVSILICILYGSSLSKIVDRRLQDVCNQLLQQPIKDETSLLWWILRQNTLVLSFIVEGSKEHPLVTNLALQLDDFLHATLLDRSLEHHVRTFIQYMGLLTGHSLLHHCPDEQVCLAFQTLLDIMFLVVQGELDCDQQTTDRLVQEICDVLMVLLKAASCTVCKCSRAQILYQPPTVIQWTI